MLAGLVAALALTAVATRSDPVTASSLLLVERFEGSDHLVTNEYARWNIGGRDAVVDDRWVVTSGSLLVRDGRGWSGPPDDQAPDARSVRSTGSATLRIHSRRSDLGDVATSLRFRLNGYVEAREGPAEAWDGLHLLLRLRSEEQLYAVSLARRDGHVDIKRKAPGGPANGGTYTTLAHVPLPPLALGVDHQARLVVDDRDGGEVALSVEVDGRVVAQAVDRGTGALTGPGAVGIRGDNLDFEVDDLVVEELGQR